MCEARSADPSTPEGAKEAVDASAEVRRAHGRQKRMAVGAVSAFVLAVIVTVAASWPTPCERAAKRICDTWGEDCNALRTVIEHEADPQVCATQLEVLSEIDAKPSGAVPRSYLYLAVVKTLVGDEKFAEFRAASGR